VVIVSTAAIRFQGWAGMRVKFRGQLVDLLIGPPVNKTGAGELWEYGLHGGSLFSRTLFDTSASIRRKAGESLLERLDVEERDGKGADAAAGATEPAGHFTEQSGGSPLKPVVCFLVERRRIWQRACHGWSFPFEGEVDDEIALG
jgi:hypothetical protein